MLQKAISNYYILLDETLGNSTCIVLLVASMVLLVGFLAPVANANSAHLFKGSILEASTQKTLSAANVVVIGGEEYEVIFSKISK